MTSAAMWCDRRRCRPAEPVLTKRRRRGGASVGNAVPSRCPIECRTAVIPRRRARQGLLSRKAAGLRPGPGHNPGRCIPRMTPASMRCTYSALITRPRPDRPRPSAQSGCVRSKARPVPIRGSPAEHRFRGADLRCASAAARVRIRERSLRAAASTRARELDPRDGRGATRAACRRRATARSCRHRRRARRRPARARSSASPVTSRSSCFMSRASSLAPDGSDRGSAAGGGSVPAVRASGDEQPVRRSSDRRALGAAPPTRSRAQAGSRRAPRRGGAARRSRRMARVARSSATENRTGKC